MQANRGEKWRQFQLIISPGDILMHYCYNYSNVLKGSSHQLFQTSFFTEWNFNKQPFWEVFLSEGAIPVHPSPLWETGLLDALKYLACYATRASLHFLAFSLAWGFLCFAFFLLHSSMTFLNSAFSEANLKYSKTKYISQAAGEGGEVWVFFFFFG